jgi:hypothetical protein
MKYASLIIVSVLSVLFIKEYDFYPNEPYDQSSNSYRFLGPGILFSWYLIVLHWKQFRMGKLIQFFIILIVAYCIALYTGLATWGVAVPFVGGLGALLVKWVFYNRGELLDAYHKDALLDSEGIKFAAIGFVTGLVGLLFFYYASNAFADNKMYTTGVGFGLIISLWQIGIGIKCITKAGNTTPTDNRSV